MENKVEEVRVSLKEARNLGYLCKYDESISHYKKIIDSIEQEIILNNVSKKSLEDWRSFQANVIQEKNSVESIKSMLAGMSFNSSSVIPRAEKPSPFYNNSIHME